MGSAVRCGTADTSEPPKQSAPWLQRQLVPVALRLTHVPSYFHMPTEQEQDCVLGGPLNALVTQLLLFSWNCQGLMTDNLLISLGRREDEGNPGAVKEGCDLCPGRPSKLFVPH